MKMQGLDEKALSAVIDRAAIQDCLARYCRGIDRRDRQLLEGSYWPDAFDDHGSYQGNAAGFIEWVLPLLDGLELTQHSLGQPLIMLDGDSAAVQTCFTAFHRMVVEGELKDVFLGGRYIDRFEKRGGEWRVGYRLMLGDWHHSAPSPSGGWQGFVMGALPAGNIGLGGIADPSTKLLSGQWHTTATD